MKPFLFYSIFLCILIHLSSCEQNTKVIEPKGEVAFFDPVELGATNQTSNLSIEATFDECGEWGGHKEKITVFEDSTMTELFCKLQSVPFQLRFTGLLLHPSKLKANNGEDRSS
jgi:hypothetical protein